MATNEPRALTAALSAPAFVTRGGGLAMHSASRHVERWAPEASSQRSRPLRNLSFVDRLLSPWIESAQRSPSLRMFSQYISNGVAERPSAPVSWVFPRPWYQDELDWMAAARVQAEQQRVQQTPAPQPMLTTRGTYVAPTQHAASLPTALYEFVAPSLSVARPPEATQATQVYSPLVPYAASEAAQVMSRAVAPLEMTQSLRGVLATMLERAAAPARMVPTRMAQSAPELVTPPAPREESAPVGQIAQAQIAQAAQAAQAAERYAAQHAQVAELQRVARAAQEREAVAARSAAPSSSGESHAQTRAAVIAQREAEIQQRLGDAATRREVERQRVEERIAERLAERTREQERAREQQVRQLHETAREAAVRDARSAAMQQQAAVVEPPVPQVRESQVAAAIQAAVTALPPELAAVVTASVGQRPDRAVQAINEISEALRTVELLARTTASGGAPETARGPRLTMPAGLGGLVATVERTRAPREMIAAREAQVAMQMAAMPAAAMQMAMQAATAPRVVAPRTMLRMPRLAQEHVAPAMPPTIAAAAQNMPAALQHVAWSDRWLARFAGARPRSLETLAVAAATPEARLRLLAQAAPESVFVAPFYDASDASDQRRVVVSTPDAPVAAPAPLPTLRGGARPETPVLRFDDDAETPDDVLAAISMAASRSRPTPVASQAAAVAAAAAAAAPTTFAARDTLADRIAYSAPSAPGAGLSAQLASSPFAPALHHLVPSGAAPTFDVRALFGEGLGATYLAGLLAASTDELSVPSATMPSWAAGFESAWAGFEPAATPLERGLDWQPTYVAPELPIESAADLAASLAATSSAAMSSSAASSSSLEAVSSSATLETIRAYEAPLRTLRTALLAWDVETVTPSAGSAPVTTVSPATITAGPDQPYARTLLESLSLPLLGMPTVEETSTAAFTAPGQIAERAHQWSIAQERSVSDLTFDFVPPELVLAARVYGLGPAEAAQAMRLAIAGPGHLSAMANTVDRTFVQAMTIEAERRARTSGTGPTATTYATMRDELASSTSSTSTMPSSAETAPVARAPGLGPTFAPSRTSFGIERRAPRGAFLWPAATTAALGMQAQGPDGDQAISVAALELLAAQAVAELGTFTALGDFGEVAGTAAGDGATAAGGGGAPQARTRTRGALPADARDEEVFESAASYVPVARREKFQALYVALGQSATGRSLSPAARAARAIALAGRGGEVVSAHERAAIAWDVLPVLHGLDSLEDELEPALAGDTVGGAARMATSARGSLLRARPEMPALSTGAAAEQASRRREELSELFVDSRPGLARLSARAGEALGLFVAPEVARAPAQTSSASSREVGALLRPPTAAPELVQTGGGGGGSPANYQRYGGGEVEIPAWFEAAAKKMFENQTPAIAESISLAELTLVSTARPQQIAASSRGVGSGSTSSTPATQSDASTTSKKPQDAMKIDVEKLAGEVYAHIQSMMDSVRSRNGES